MQKVIEKVEKLKRLNLMESCTSLENGKRVLHRRVTELGREVIDSAMKGMGIRQDDINAQIDTEKFNEAFNKELVRRGLIRKN